MREAMKKNWKGMLLAAVIILLPMVVGVVLWDRLPDPMATHWDFAGNADGWTSRAFTVYGIPLVMLALQILLKGYGYDLGTWGPNGDGIDSDFGADTKAAVQEFQRAVNEDDDGEVGPKTWAALLGV